MSEPFIGEIRMFAGNFAPLNWNFCDGSILAISQNDALFNLIGTTYGGDGVQTFALPDLRGRVPVHQASGYVLGQVSGSETVTLVTSQLPQHSHLLAASSNAATADSPQGNYPAQWSDMQYSNPSVQPANASMNSGVMTAVGNNQPHDNMMPYQCISFIIALYGIYPSQN
jgi:microcystin-dependent protein